MAHKGGTNACSFAPSGRRLATGGDDAVVRIWSVKSGERVGKLKGHKGPITCCLWDPLARDKRIVSADAKGAIKVWRAKKDYTPSHDEEGGDGWAPDWNFDAHKASVLSVSFVATLVSEDDTTTTDDGPRSRLASCSRDGTVKLWCLKTMAELACVVPSKVSVSYYQPASVALCGPGGSWAFVCGDDGLCHLLDFGSSSEIGCTDLGSKAKCCAATWLDYHAEGVQGLEDQELAWCTSCVGVGCEDGSLRAMPVDHARYCVMDLFESRGALAFARGQVDRDDDNGSGGGGGGGGKGDSHLEGRSVAISLSGRKVLAARGPSEDDGGLGSGTPVVSLHYTDAAAAAGGGGGQPVHVLGIPKDTHFDPTCCSLSPCERFAVVGSEDGLISVWDLGVPNMQSGEADEEGGQDTARSDIETVAEPEQTETTTEGGVAKETETDTATEAEQAESSKGGDTDKEQKVDGKAGGEKRNEDKEQEEQGKAREITRVDLVGHEEAVLCVTFTPNGKFMVSCGWESAVRCWNVTPSGCSAMGEPQETEHGDWIKSCAFRPGLASKGNILATAANDGEVRFWDTGLGDLEAEEGDELEFALVGQVDAHFDCVNSICFSPDGLLLVTASDDTTAKVWTMSEESDSLGLAKPLRSLSGHAGPVTSAAFIGAERVVTCSWDRTLRVWTTDEGKIEGMDDFEFADELPEELRQGKQEICRVGGFYADLVGIAALCTGGGGGSGGGGDNDAVWADTRGNVVVISKEGAAQLLKLN